MLGKQQQHFNAANKGRASSELLQGDSDFAFKREGVAKLIGRSHVTQKAPHLLLKGPDAFHNASAWICGPLGTVLLLEKVKWDGNQSIFRK